MKKILIVEDEILLQELLEEIFIDVKWETKVAQNGKVALEMLETYKPDVILSDINMPLVDGLQMLERLCTQDNSTPVIFLTGYRDLVKMKTAWQLCVFDFIDKPFNKDHLVSMCDKAYEFGRDYVETARKRFQQNTDSNGRKAS